MNNNQVVFENSIVFNLIFICTFTTFYLLDYIFKYKDNRLFITI